MLPGPSSQAGQAQGVSFGHRALLRPMLARSPAAHNAGLPSPVTAFCGGGLGVNRLSPLRGRSPRQITRKPHDPGCARGDGQASTAKTGYEAGFRWYFSACSSAWLIIADAMGCLSSWAASLSPASPAPTRPITSGSTPIPMKCSPGVPALAPAGPGVQGGVSPVFGSAVVAVIDAKEPEQAEATAAGLATALARRPCAFSRRQPSRTPRLS